MQKSTSRFGLSEDEWQSAKQQLRDAIVRAAWERRMTSYSAVASAITTVKVDPHSALLNHLLGEVFRDEHDAGRPALTSIVTHRDGDKEPGPGFYDQAKALGYHFNEPYVFWSMQVQDVFKLHGRPEHRRVSI